MVSKGLKSNYEGEKEQDSNLEDVQIDIRYNVLNKKERRGKETGI